MIEEAILDEDSPNEMHADGKFVDTKKVSLTAGAKTTLAE